MKVTLHLGATKTGSTSLQTHLADGGAVLAGAGIHYPQAGRAAKAHHLMIAALHPDAWHLHHGKLPAAPQARREAFHAMMEQALAEASRAGAGHMVLSSEYLWGSFEPAMGAAIAEALAGHEVRLVAVLRRQDRWLESSYLQALKYGEARDFEPWLAGFRANPQSGSDYLSVLQGWSAALAPCDLHLRRYEFSDATAFTRAMLDLVCDAPLGSALVPRGARKINRSAGSNAAASLRRLNDLLPSARLSELRRHLSQLPGLRREAGASATAFLTPEIARRIMAEAAPVNQAIAARWFAGQTGPLFDLPDLTLPDERQP